MPLVLATDSLRARRIRRPLGPRIGGIVPHPIGPEHPEAGETWKAAGSPGVLLHLNRGSFFEPPFKTRGSPQSGNHARGGSRVSRARLRGGRHAGHRDCRRSVARQPVSLLPRQGRTALLLPGPRRGSAAARARHGPAPTRTAAGAPSRSGHRPCSLSAGRSRGLGGASRGQRAAAPPSLAHRRQARCLRTRRARARLLGGPGRHAGRSRRPRRHARLPGRAQLDGALVPSRGTAIGPTGRRTGRRLCRQWIDQCRTTYNSR